MFTPTCLRDSLHQFHRITVWLSTATTAQLASTLAKRSPTVRINGLDAEPSAVPKFGLACRLYSSGSGVPSEQILSRAVKDAKQKEDSE